MKESGAKLSIEFRTRRRRCNRVEQYGVFCIEWAKIEQSRIGWMDKDKMRKSRTRCNRVGPDGVEYRTRYCRDSPTWGQTTWGQTT